MSSPHRVSVSLTHGSKLKLQELVKTIGCSESHVASRALGEWLEGNYDRLSSFYKGEGAILEA